MLGKTSPLLTNFHLSFRARIARLKDDTLIRSCCPQEELLVQRHWKVFKGANIYIVRLWNFRNRSLLRFYYMRIYMAKTSSKIRNISKVIKLFKHLVLSVTIYLKCICTLVIFMYLLVYTGWSTIRVFFDEQLIS